MKIFPKFLLQIDLLKANSKQIFVAAENFKSHLSRGVRVKANKFHFGVNN